MSDKNLDVDRAIASIGGETWTYHSFTPELIHSARTGATKLFTYNDLGEPQYAGNVPLLESTPSFASPDDEYMEDAAYPQSHPGERWYEVPAPEDHTSRFIPPSLPAASAEEPLAPPAPMPDVVAPPVLAPPVLSPPVLASTPMPSPVIVSPVVMSPALVAPALVAPALIAPALIAPAIIAPAAFHVTDKSPTPPVFAAAPAPTMKRPAYVPFLPSGAPQHIAPTIASPIAPNVAPNVVPTIAPPAAVAQPLYQPTFQPASPPPERTPFPAAPPSRAPLVASAPPRAGAAEATPYPQPFGTLSDMYAKMAKAHKDSVVPAASPAGPVEAEELKMFRRL